MNHFEIKNMDIMNFILEHQEDVIVIGYGGSDYKTSKGYYCMGLLYKNHMKFVEGSAEGTPNSCMLQGILEAVRCLRKSTNVYLLTTTALGFKKALKNKGPNEVLCNEIVKCVEEEKNCNLTIYSLHDRADEIRRLMKNASSYFKILN